MMHYIAEKNIIEGLCFQIFPFPVFKYVLSLSFKDMYYVKCSPQTNRRSSDWPAAYPHKPAPVTATSVALWPGFYSIFYSIFKNKTLSRSLK